MLSTNEYCYVLPEEMAIGVNTDDLLVSANYLQITATSSFELTGIQAPVEESHACVFRLKNDAASGSGLNITLKQNTASAAGNRFFMLTGADVVLAPQQYAIFNVVTKGFVCSQIIT